MSRSLYGSTLVRCPKCSQYVRYRLWTEGKHACGGEEIVTPNFRNMTHKDVLAYYGLHPQEIEKGMVIIFREMGIFRGKVDLVGRDEQQNVCLIEVAHLSNQTLAYWKKKLYCYRSYLRLMSERIFKIEDWNARLILIKPGISKLDIE